MHSCAPAAPLLADAASATGFGIEDVRAEAAKWDVLAANDDRDPLCGIRESYCDIVDLAAKDAGLRLDAVPLYGAQVEDALDAGACPLLLVHSHRAAEALRAGRYALLALSSDIRDNRVSFVARKDAGIATLADLKGKSVVSTGSLCTAIAKQVLARAALLDRLDAFRHVRDGEALPFFLGHQYFDVGVTRSAALLDGLARCGATLIHQTEPCAVYALLAASTIDAPLLTRLREAFLAWRPQPGSAFVQATGIGGFAAPDAAGALPELLR